MGVIARPSKPVGGGATTEWTAGSDLHANELNADINPVYVEVNGNLDNANIKALAAIDAAKLADNSITTIKYAATSVTKPKIAAANISADKLDTTEYTNSGSIGPVGNDSVANHDTGVSSSTRQALVCWFNSAVNTPMFTLRSSGGTWHIMIYLRLGPVTFAAGELRMLHIAKT